VGSHTNFTRNEMVQVHTPSRRGETDLYGSNISSAESSTSSQVRTRNTFLEVLDEGEHAYMEHVKSSRSYSMPELVTREQQRDLASILLAHMQDSGLAGSRDITTAICANVENILPLADRENWSNAKVYSLIRDRGFDADGLISKVEILNSFGKVKLKFVDHASLVSFKLLFDQGSFDGVSPCTVTIVDCCCGTRIRETPVTGAAPRVAEPPPLELILPKESNRLFVGGLAPETTDESLRMHFEKYGKLIESSVILDKRSKQSRGFGFLAFQFGIVPEYILSDQHVIDGKSVGIRLYGKGRD
jgi:hypothetical protein